MACHSGISFPNSTSDPASMALNQWCFGRRSDQLNHAILWSEVDIFDGIDIWEVPFHSKWSALKNNRIFWDLRRAWQDTDASPKIALSILRQLMAARFTAINDRNRNISLDAGFFSGARLCCLSSLSCCSISSSRVMLEFARNTKWSTALAAPPAPMITTGRSAI